MTRCSVTKVNRRCATGGQVSESALFALTKWQTRHLVERHPAQGARVTRLLAEPWELLGTLVLGNVLIRGLRLTATAADERRVRELLVEVASRKGGR